MRKSNYIYTIDNGQLLIRDCWSPGFLTVTNNIENVLTEIRREIGELILELKVIYRDTDNNWDEVKPIWDGNICNNVKFL
jgi:hypothetical protein